MVLGEPSRTCSTNAGYSDGTVNRFPMAAQPEIMRAAEKDDQYASFVYEACRDAFRHLFGTRVAVAYQNEAKFLGQMLYYMLTTGAGKQTLGEEYCDITQVAGPYGLSPTPARRALFIFYQSAVPYIAESVSSRVASRGITLADSMAEYPFGDVPTSSNEAEASPTVDIQSSSTSTPSISALSRLKAKIRDFWLYAVLRWPSVLPLARLRRSNLSSISASAQQAPFGTYQTSTDKNGCTIMDFHHCSKGVTEASTVQHQ